MKRVLGTVISLFLFVHGFALAQGDSAENPMPSPGIATDTVYSSSKALIDSAGIALGSAGVLMVPGVTGTHTPEGPAAGSDPSTAEPNAAMARPKEAVP